MPNFEGHVEKSPQLRKAEIIARLQELGQSHFSGGEALNQELESTNIAARDANQMEKERLRKELRKVNQQLGLDQEDSME